MIPISNPRAVAKVPSQQADSAHLQRETGPPVHTMCQNRELMTRRTASLALLSLPGLRLLGQSASAPDGYKVYTEAPRLLLRPARLKLLRREKERQSLRWEQ